MKGSSIEATDAIRVLMVDDEEAQGEISSLNLCSIDSSLSIDLEKEPRKALDTLRVQLYECIVSDYQMPGLNGIQLCAEIRRFSRIPFIIYTGRGSEEVASKAFAAGVDDYVRKESVISHYRLLARRIRHAVERRRYEDLYRISIEDNRDGFSLIQGTNFVYANQAMARMLGLSSPRELIGGSILRWIVEMERDLIGGRALSRQGGHDEPRVYEYNVRRIDGEIRTLEASVSLINYQGKPASLVFNHDITDRKRNEEALRKSEGSLRRSQEMASLGSWEHDHTDDSVVWSHETYRVFGLGSEAFKPSCKEVINYVHPDDKAMVEEKYLASVRDGVECDFEHRIRKPNGEVRFVHEKCEHIKDKQGRITHSIGMIQDITERRLSQDAQKALNADLEVANYHLQNLNTELSAVVDELRTSQEKQRTLNEELQASNDQLRMSREELRRYSDTLEDMVRERTSEIMRNEEKLRESSLYSRSLIEASLDPFITISAEGKITDVNEATVQMTGVTRGELVGSDFSGYFTEPKKAREGYQRVFEDGYVRDYPLTMRHVSGRVTQVLYHATLYRDSNGVVQGVFAAARDITNRRRSEERIREAEKNAAIGKLTTLVAHDLRNPLNFISQASELARTQPEKTDRMLQLIKESAARSLAIIEDLRQITREITLTRIDVNLSSLIRGVAEQTSASDKICVSIDIPDLLDANIDPSMMKRVLESLVGNAVEAMPRGGRLTMRARKSGDETLIDIQDTGMGIPDDAIPHIFDPFYTSKPKGLGLGLTLVRRIIEAHDGILTFETKVGVGTTFRISLPAKQGKPQKTRV